MHPTRLNRALWRAAWPAIRRTRLIGVEVHLNDVDYLSNRTGDLLLPIGPAEQTKSERASAAVDFINQRFGTGTIQYGVNQPHPGFFERG